MSRASMLVALVVSVSAALVACGSPNSCDSSNCPGCCLAGVCSAGTTNTECGTRGNLCIACPAGQVCRSGSCAPGGSGGGATGGGTGGGATGGGATGGGTTGGGATGGGATGGGTTGGGTTGGGGGGCTMNSCPTPTDLCLNNACSTGLGRGYRVTFVSATAPTTDSTGAAWDALGGAPDLVACLTVDNGTPTCTSEVSDAFTANWNQSAQVTVVASTQVRIDFVDVDVSANDTIDAFTISSSVFIDLARRGGLMGRPYANAPSTWNIRIEPL